MSSLTLQRTPWNPSSDSTAKNAIMRAGSLFVVATLSLLVSTVIASQPVRLETSGGMGGDRSGSSGVLGEDFAAVGAPYAESQGIRSGSIRLLRTSGIDWVTFAELGPSDGVPNQRFGAAVDADDDWIAVGAPGDTSLGASAGAVYLYKKNGGIWGGENKIFAPDGSPGDEFGIAVTLSSFGARRFLAIGADGSDDTSSNAGAVYIYEWVTGAWSYQQKLVAFDAAAEDRFGRALAMDGERLLIGAWLHSGPAPASGVVYAYRLVGTDWTYLQSLSGPTAMPGEGFGLSIDIDDTSAVIGAPFRDGPVVRGGGASVFEWDGLSWEWKADLVAPQPFPDDRHGTDVSIADGFIVAGSWLSDRAGDDAGSVEVYRFSSGLWEHVETWTSAHPDRGAHFGTMVDLRGTKALVGAPDEDVTSPDGGGAYLVRVPVPPRFVRGDCNSDGELDLADAIETLNRLFISGSPRCRVACDTNDDGLFDVSDAIAGLSFLFAIQPRPPAPYPACGFDPTPDTLDCDVDPACP